VDGYETIARVLKAEGVEFIAAFPHQLLIEAAAKVGIRPIIPRQERVGVNIADGFSRIANGRRFGVFTMQQGPGAENTFAGVAQAHADSVPILLLPGGERISRQGIHPTFDAVRNYRHVTKWAARIHRASDIPGLMRHAVAQLKHGRRSPVLLEMPIDVMADYAANDVAYSPVQQWRSAASAEDVRDLITALLKASEPTINAGQGVLYAEATPELIEFAELSRIPVMTTLAGKSAFPENHPLALGTGGLSRTPMVSRFTQMTDFVLGVGTSFTRSLFTTPMPDGIVLGQVTNCADDIGKDYDVRFAAVGDAKLVLRQLIEEFKRQDGPRVRGDGNGIVKRVARVRDDYAAQWEPRLRSEEVPISPYRVFRELETAFDISKTIMTHDSGYPRDQLVPTWKAVTPRSYIGWGKSTQLGYGLGLSIGAKLAAPDRQVINIMGDAAFGMTGLDIETAVRAEVPILTVVLNNGVMTNYDSYMPEATKLFGSNAMGGHYAQVAEALGAHAERVDAPAGLASAIRRAKAANREGRPALLEVLTKVELDVPM
jgi:acetolactate synthase-1/2/3 large subunit